MVNYINTADVIGDHEFCAQFLSRTLTEYKDNRVTKLRRQAFYGCKSLTIVDLPNVQSIETEAFRGATGLKSFILRGNTVVTLATRVFADINAANTGLHIYVPARLVDTYKSATNWSAFASYFRAIEDYTVDGTLTGELDESKI